MPETIADGTSLQLLETRLGDKQTKKKKFDPTVIIAIITALLPLIANCFKPTPQALRRRLGNRARLAWAIHGQLPGASLADCFDHADDVLDVANESTDDELKAFVDECNS